MNKSVTTKIAGFGFCTKEATAKDVIGSVQWMAPEMLRNYGKKTADAVDVYDKRCDVFRLECVFVCVFECKCIILGATARRQEDGGCCRRV